MKVSDCCWEVTAVDGRNRISYNLKGEIGRGYTQHLDVPWHYDNSVYTWV